MIPDPMIPDPKTVREDDDAFCPHTAYPLQVTLTLIEGEMTVRHTECGRTVLTDWPYLRAHDMPLTLAYATDDQDEDWLELRLPAGLDEWLQEDEQQPADVVTAEQQQDGAAEDVTAFLDALPPRIDIVADWTRNGVRTELTAEALRAVLAERAQMAKLLGIGTDPEQWDAIAEAEGRRFEGEQANDTLVGYLAYQRESSRALSSFLQSEVKELEAERTALAARVAELEAERDLWRTRAYQVGNMVIGERDPEVVPFLWAPGQESTATETEES